MTKKVSFDFDDTLTFTAWRHENGRWVGRTGANHRVVRMLLEHAANGDEIHIVTYRRREHEDPEWIATHEPNRVSIQDFVTAHNLPIANVWFTDHQPKGPLLAELGVDLHYDDDLDAIWSAEEYGVEGVYVKGFRETISAEGSKGPAEGLAVAAAVPPSLERQPSVAAPERGAPGC